MCRSWAITAGILLLAACTTTSTVHQAHSAPTDQVFAHSFSNQGGADQQGIAQLDGVIQSHLRQAGLIDVGTASPKIEVVVKHYYVRSNGAQVGNFDVETFNSTAWGTTDDLMQKHAEELVARLKAS